MNGKKGSNSEVKIGIPPPVNGEVIVKESHIYGVSIRQWIGSVWRFGREDANRVKFAIKVGLALVLSSLLILCGPTYRVFGESIIWSIITVAIMFEYTVGATFNKGFNRALGSLFAGVFAIAVMEAAISSGSIADPYVIGFSIFFVGAVTSFVKLWPSLVPYEYGFRVAMFTYCMIIISGYRIGMPIRTAIDRLYSIAIGGAIAVLVNVLIWPIWAGEQLHQEVVKHFNSVADALEECVKKYLMDDGTEQPEFVKTVMDDFADEPAFKRFRATLNSSTKFDSLASSAKWEPPHGRFGHFSYPWAEYVKVGTVLRHCAYEVMALHGCLHSEIQAPYKLRIAFQSEILDAANQAAELLRNMAADIKDMTRNLHGNLLKRLHSSTDRLQRSIELHSYLLTSSHDLSNYPPINPPKKLASSIVTSSDFKDQRLLSTTAEQSATSAVSVERLGSYHENMMRQQKRLYSWPSREVDDFEDADVEKNMMPVRMRASESTTALSLATFTSLIIEFVARLDHLVDAVDELGRLANFKEKVAG